MRTSFSPLLIALILLSSSVSAQDSKENSDFKLAVSLYNDKMYDLALEQFKQFINLFPNSQQSVEARYYIGLTQYKLKKYDDARYSFQNFALAYPDNVRTPDAWMNVADVYVTLKNFREAGLAYERVKSFNPKSKQAPTALLKAADYYQKAGEREDAKRVLRVLTQEYSDPAVILPGHLQYAELLMGDKDYEGARSECKKVIESTKDPILRPEALLLMAQISFKLAQFKDSQTALDEVITSFQSSPSYPSALLLLGSLQMEWGNLTDAMSTWRKLAEDSSKTPRKVYQDALMRLGEASLLDGQFKSSMGYFVRAGNVGGSRAGEAWFKAGKMAEKVGDRAAVAGYFGKAVNDTASAIDRREVLISGMKADSISGDYADAIRLAEEYRMKYPDDPNLARVMFESAGICRDNLKDYRKAIDFYDEVLERFPQSACADDAMYGLGKAFRLSGQFNDAITTLESLAKRYPDSDFIERAESEAEYTRLFELKDKESGLEKLALLIGDVIAQQSKGDLAYRLAEIYFHELKDYRQAAIQYKAALDAGLDPNLRPGASLNLARSFDYLNLKDRFSDEKGAADRDAAFAITVYDSLLAKYPEQPFIADAALARLKLKLQLAKTPPALRKLGSNFSTSSLYGRNADEALLELGRAYEQAGDFEDAALTFKVVSEQSPPSESAAEAQFRLGKALMGLADQDSAAAVLTSFISNYPNRKEDAEAASILARYLSRIGQADRANSLYDLIERKYHYTSFASELDRKRGEAYLTAGMYSKAADAFVKQINTIRSDYFSEEDVPLELIYKAGYAFEKLGDNEQAKQYYTEFVTRAYDSDLLGHVYYSLASIARNEGNSELAARYLQESLKHTPASSEEAVTLSLEAADLLFNDGKFVDAIARYEEVAKQAKRDSLKQALESRIIVCYYRLDNIKEADKRAAVFEKEHAKSIGFLAGFECERGKYFLRKGDTGQALTRLEKVTREYRHTPVVPEALYWTGKTYELAEQPRTAISLYDSVIRYYPRSDMVPQAHLSLGNVYYNLEQWDSAAQRYRILVDSTNLSPDLVKYAMNNLALTYKQLKLYDAAMELDRKYIERYPDADDIVDKKIDIAVLYQNLGFYDQSILQLQSLLEMGNPTIEAELRYYMGEAYFYKGTYQQAILEFLKVPYLVTKRGKVDWVSTSYYMAGQSYEKMSKFDLAMTMYKKIVDDKNTDTEFKTAARREIDRVQALVGK